MTIRPARLSDFTHLETFVWQAIFPAFDVAGLTDVQRAENDALVERAREEVADVLGRDYYAVYVAIAPKTNSLAGYIIVDARPGAYAEIKRLIVKRAFRGKGVGELLLDEATNFIGTDRAVSLIVRYYNARAIAFFAKHGFVDTTETSGNHAIPRTLMLREADTVQRAILSAHSGSAPSSFGADFPTEADEPLFEPLPDYTLATDETPLFETGANALRTEDLAESGMEDSSLTEDQLSVLEAFIAKARAKKQGSKSVDAFAEKPAKAPTKAFDRSKITFEVDFGQVEEAAREPVDPPKLNVRDTRPKASFAFDFAPVTEEVPLETVMAPVQAKATPTPNVANEPKQQEEIVDAKSTIRSAPSLKAEDKKATKICPDCSTKLPTKARFCFVCGLPQPTEPPPSDTPPSEILDDVLELPELPSTPAPQAKEQSATTTPKEFISSSDKTKVPVVTTGELRKAFRSYLEDRVVAYFGTSMLAKYLSRLEESSAFQQVRDGSLSNLATWLNAQPAADLAKVRKQNTFADLTEYFIVETAADLSRNVLPQRLLRHQSVNWQTADLFKLVMDYLDFATETESVHTDFVSMPARALKNATKSFLHAAKDERVFFICDQSLISRAKNGFAVTDSGIYWKNVLQPAGASTFTTMQAPRVEQGHLVIDGQFFDAGGRLNLKVAVLLDKLRRMTG